MSQKRIALDSLGCAASGMDTDLLLDMQPPCSSDVYHRVPRYLSTWGVTWVCLKREEQSVCLPFGFPSNISTWGTPKWAVSFCFLLGKPTRVPLKREPPTHDRPLKKHSPFSKRATPTVWSGFQLAPGASRRVPGKGRILFATGARTAGGEEQNGRRHKAFHGGGSE